MRGFQMGNIIKLDFDGEGAGYSEGCMIQLDRAIGDRVRMRSWKAVSLARTAMLLLLDWLVQGELTESLRGFWLR
jgi:hypothetical protein